MFKKSMNHFYLFLFLFTLIPPNSKAFNFHFSPNSHARLKCMNLIQSYLIKSNLYLMQSREIKISLLLLLLLLLLLPRVILLYDLINFNFYTKNLDSLSTFK